MLAKGEDGELLLHGHGGRAALPAQFQGQHPLLAQGKHEAREAGEEECEGVFSSFNAIYPGVTTTIAFLLLATPCTNFLRTRSGIEFAYRSGTFIVSRIFRGRGTIRPCCAKKGAANKLCGGNDRRKS